jgi:arginase
LKTAVQKTPSEHHCAIKVAAFMKIKVQIIQVPYDSGHRSLRMGSGPEYFGQSGVDQVLRRDGHDVQMEAVEAKDSFRAEIKTSFELYRLLAERVRAARGEGRFPLVLSGNCGSAIGTVAGLGSDRLGVIWFDGHGDFNTPETTTTGFLDGMGLAIVAGLCWKTLAASVPTFSPIPAVNVLHVGGRDFEQEERALLDSCGVTVVGAEGIRRSGVRAALAPELQALRRRVEAIYLHFDLDVLDPQEAPANEFAPPDGLTLSQVEQALRMIGEQFRILASGIASYDSHSDRDDRALRAGVRIMQTILATQERPAEEILT